MKTKRFIPVVAAICVFALSACGGGGSSQTTVSTKTLGEELTDLKQAYDAGAISEKEYEKAREEILERYEK